MQYLSKIYLPFKIVEDKVPQRTRVVERALIVILDNMKEVFLMECNLLLV